MPHCFVKQPNGNYAIWSSVVDNFIELDCTRDEAVQISLRHDSGGYPGGIEALKKSLESEFEHIEKSGIAWDWAHDWNECLRWLERFDKDGEAMKIIDANGWPHRMKRTISPLKCERYWRYFWRNRCQELEMRIRFPAQDAQP